MRRSRLLLTLFALALLGVSASVVLALTRPSEDTVATSGVVPQRYVVAVGAGDRECQTVSISKGSADVVRVSAAGRQQSIGPIRLSIRGRGLNERASLAGGLAEFSLSTPLNSGDHELCFTNAGRRTLFLAGEGPDVLATEDLTAEVGTYSLWIALEDQDPDAWWSRMRGMITRVGAVVGAPLGGASGWLALVLYGVAIALALLGGAAAACVARRGDVDGRGGVQASRHGSLERVAVGRWGLASVAAIAAASGAAWAIITPTFQVPDEPAHYAYVQYIGEMGKLPGGSPELQVYSDEQVAATEAIGTNALVGRADNRARESRPGFEAALENSTALDSGNGGGQTGASPQPPLYYALAALPYRASSWAPLPVQVLVLRLFSVLFFAATAVMVALVVRELFPSFVWAPFVAGAVVALQPMIGFISAGATPEAMMDLVAVGLVLAAVRGLKRPTTGAAIAIGLLGGAGAVTKITLVALVPAAGLAVGLVANRLRTAGRTAEARRAAVFGIGALAALPLAYCAWTLYVGRGLFPPGASPGLLPAEQIGPASAREFISYAWQLYLPRAPWQTDQFVYLPLEETWIFGWLGRYGWLDYGIDGWLRDLGMYVIAFFAALAVSGAVQHRSALRARSAELAVLVALTLGLAAVIAAGGYQYQRNTGLPFEQARYLFPLAGLYGALAVLATLGVGPKLRPVVIWLLFLLCSVHALSGPFLTLTRYYA